MDAAGKQELHIGSYSSKTCSCPKRLAAGTVDSYIGKLRSIFNWHILVLKNIIIMFVREEQAQRPL